MSNTQGGLVGTATLATAPRSVRRTRAFRVVVAALTFAATVGGAEALLAVAGVPRGAPPESVADARDFADPRAYVPDAALLWRLRPNEALDVPELAFVDVRTDSRGLRGADRDGELRSSRLRVLCLGDSVTFGLKLRREETFPSCLEHALRGRLPPETSPVVVNCGVPGYSSIQGMRLLDELAPLSPDVVVWWFGMNDAKPALGAPDSELRLPRPPGAFLSFLRQLRSFRIAERLADGVRPNATRVSEAQWRETVAALEQRAAAGGPAVVFVRCPSRLDEKLAGLDAIATAVRAADATIVSGASNSLSTYVPGPPGDEVVTGMEDRPDGRVALLAAGSLARKEISVGELTRRRDHVGRWKAAVDEYNRGLPADAMGYADLFGSAQPAVVFWDNCHLTAGAARIAAESVAIRVAEAFERRQAVRRR